MFSSTNSVILSTSGVITGASSVINFVFKLSKVNSVIKQLTNFQSYSKKEVAQIMKKLDKLSKTLGGIKEMRGMPEMLFIVDQQEELIAINNEDDLKLNDKNMIVKNTNQNSINVNVIFNTIGETKQTTERIHTEYTLIFDIMNCK